jgi:hypothetical protein
MSISSWPVLSRTRLAREDVEEVSSAIGELRKDVLRTVQHGPNELLDFSSDAVFGERDATALYGGPGNRHHPGVAANAFLSR